MPRRKYDKYVISGPQPWNPTSSGYCVAWVNAQADQRFGAANQYHVHWVYESPKNVEGWKGWGDMAHGPHEHKQPEAVIHIGTNSDDPLDLGGEVWFYLGPEKELHVITQSSFVYLPAGFIHSPWLIKKVTRPFVIVTVMQEVEHTERPHPEICTEDENRKMMYIDQGYTSPERKVILPEGVKREW